MAKNRKKTSDIDNAKSAQRAELHRSDPARPPAAETPPRSPLERVVAESEAVLRSFFDSPGVMRGVVEIVAEDDVRHIADNAVTAGFLGLTPEAMQGKLGSELGEPPEILRTWIGHYRHSQSTGQPVCFEYLDQRSERQAWLSATVCYLETTPQGNPRFSYIAQDITEQKEANVHAAQLRESNENLTAVNEELAASNEELRATTEELQSEIEDRKKAEAAVRRSQQTFSELVERAPFGIYIINSQFRIAHMNANSQTGAFRNVRPVIGRDFAEAMRILWPEPVAAEILAVFRHTLETGEPYYSPRFTHPRHDVATEESYEWELHRMTLPDGQYGVICYYYDSTELRQAEAAVAADLAALTRMHALSGRVVEAVGLEPLLQETMDTAVAIVQADKGTLQLLEGGTLRIMAQHGHERPFLDFFAAAENVASVCGAATRRGERVVVPDVETSPLFAGTASLPVLRAAGVRAVQSTPLRTRAGRLLGILTTQWATPHTPDEHNLWRLDLLARQAADFIEQKQAETALRESEERFRSVFTSNVAALALWDARGHLLDANDRFLEVLGYTRAQFEAGQVRWDEATPPEMRQRDYDAVKELQAGREIKPYEKEFVRPDGTRVPVLIGGSILPGTPDIGVAFAIEITERKRGEAALRESEFHLARAQQMAHLGSWAWDIGADHLYWSDETYRLFGLQPGEFVPRSEDLFGFIHPEDRPGVEQATQNALAHRPYNLDFRIVRKGGEERYVHSEGQTLFDTEDHPVKMEGTVQDITEHKQAEESLRRMTEELQTVMETVPTAIFITRDPECRTIVGNRAAREIVALPPGANISKSAPEAERPTQWQEMRDGVPIASEDLPLQQAARGQEIRDYEMDLVFQDGTVKSILGQARPLTDREGKPQGGVAVLLDLTTIKKADETLRELNATLESKVAQRTAQLEYRAKQLQKLTLELSQAEERERRRIATILHEDLQQQIAGAKFHLGLVRNRTKEDRQRADIDSVDTMLKDAIDKSRTLSRDLSPAVLHMNDLAELLQWLTNRLRAQQGLDVKLATSGDMMLHSEALGTFLFRAAQEMLFNVVKHAHVREAAIRVRRIRGCVCLSVSDQGRGFDPQKLRETSGLGLFSIRERVELLGGRMKVKSTAGQGSKLSILVPDGPEEGKNVRRLEGEKVGGSRAPSDLLSFSPSSPSGAVRVLLVDDHDVVREGLAAMLREAPGIELVGEAPDGREAVDLAAKLRPDVVIMDVSMPLLSGDQATRQIKTHLPQTRVIALSMYDEAEKRQKMFEAGAEGYLLKTISADELLAAIRGA